MSGKLNEIEVRTATQLEAVTTAMRGIAAARAHEAQARLAGIRAAAATVGAAIGDVLSIAAPEPAATPSVRTAEIVIVCAEQGFVGAFNEHILERAIGVGEPRSREFMMVGTRGAMLAAAHGLRVAWTAPMAAHAEGVTRLASRMTDALYGRLGATGAARVSIACMRCRARRPGSRSSTACCRSTMDASTSRRARCPR